jgi:iron complex outermembrane receptor protein
MKLDKLFPSLLVTSAIALWLGTPAKGEEVGKNIVEVNNNISVPPRQREKQEDVIQIMGVAANPSDKGVEIILQTTQGKMLQPVTLASDRTYIADIPNAVLTLPQGGEFRQDNPAGGITSVTVTQATPNSIRVTVTGAATLPQVEFYDSPDRGLIFSIAPGTSTAESEKPTPEDGQQIEIVVTGERDEGYNPSNATTATRTDTPLRDIPQSIQVVPRQVLEDRGVRSEREALETVSGVVEFDSSNSPFAANVSIRGFGGFGTTRLRNGLRTESDSSSTFTPIGTIERVEVLKGPASVLFGSLEPGGVVNYATRQPLTEPYYKIGFELGNYGFYQPSIDLSGPLTEDGSVLYRLIAAYQGGGDFTNSSSIQDRVISIAPSITFRFGDRTNLNIYYDYSRFDADPYFDPILSDGSLIPRQVYTVYFASQVNEVHRFGYNLNHKFNDSWQLRHHLGAAFSNASGKFIEYTNLLEDRFLTDYIAYSFDFPINKYFGVIDVVGKFNTGSISHQLVAGFDFDRQVVYRAGYDNLVDLPPLDIFNPNYDVPLPEIPTGSFNFFEINQAYGVYLQDQIAFTDNLKMLIGGRYDWLSNETGPLDGDRTSQDDGAFSPRIGLVYQPTQNVSLYASYSQSFRPSIGRNPDNKPFKPTRGTQYEVGVKADFLDGKLSTTLAAYNLTRTNVLTPDPDAELARQGFSVQVGEQRSRGIELDVTGEILPGWNIIAAYALTDTEVTKDNSIPSIVGNRFQGIPQHQASLWTTYTVQKGDLQGLGFGLGLFYVGERQADLENSFQLGDYLRTDAAIYYRRNGFNAAINVRNLFDIDYVSSGSSGTLFVNRGDPFTIIGSVSWEF